MSDLGMVGPRPLMPSPMLLLLLLVGLEVVPGNVYIDSGPASVPESEGAEDGWFAVVVLLLPVVLVLLLPFDDWSSVM